MARGGAAAVVSATSPGVADQLRGRELPRCDFWFASPHSRGFAQARAASRLPALTRDCGHSRWLGAALVPSRRTTDPFLDWWPLTCAVARKVGYTRSAQRCQPAI